MNEMVNKQSDYSMTSEKSIRKMQRILDKLQSEIAEKHGLSDKSMLTLTSESQRRLMNYKELYLHRKLIGEDELNTLYKSMSEIEKSIADEGVAALTFVIEALEEQDLSGVLL